MTCPLCPHCNPSLAAQPVKRPRRPKTVQGEPHDGKHRDRGMTGLSAVSPGIYTEALARKLRREEMEACRCQLCRYALEEEVFVGNEDRWNAQRLMRAARFNDERYRRVMSALRKRALLFPGEGVTP